MTRASTSYSDLRSCPLGTHWVPTGDTVVSSIAERPESARLLNRNRRKTAAKILAGHEPLTLEERRTNARNAQLKKAKAANCPDYIDQSDAGLDAEKQAQVGKWFPVVGCGRFAQYGKDITLYQRQSARVDRGGVQRCGSVWLCAECADLIQAERAAELCSAINKAREAGDAVIMLTFTFAHDQKDECKPLVRGVAESLRKARQSSGFRNVQNELDFVGMARALEITHGRNGWHPHTHELWFLEGVEPEALTKEFLKSVKERLYKTWLSQCLKIIGKMPSLEHGIDIRVVWSATDYLAKKPTQAKALHEDGRRRWGVESEMTKSARKKGRIGGKTFFELLDDAADGDGYAEKLILEYSKATWRTRQMYWTPSNRKTGKIGIRERYDLSRERTDEEIANDEAKRALDREKFEAQDPVSIEVTLHAKDSTRFNSIERRFIDNIISEVEGERFTSVVGALEARGWNVTTMQRLRDPGNPAKGKLTTAVATLPLRLRMAPAFGPKASEMRDRREKNLHLSPELGKSSYDEGDGAFYPSSLH